MTKEESDKKYYDELCLLYNKAKSLDKFDLAAFLLEKVRNMELYMIRPTREEDDAAI